MKNVSAIFRVYKTQTDIAAPDVAEDDWLSFSAPGNKDKGLFSFNDGEGEIEILVRGENSFQIAVWGEIEDEVIESPDSANSSHQKIVLKLCKRAFTALNAFILRYRINTFNYRNQPLKWFSSIGNPEKNVPATFTLDLDTSRDPLDFTSEWEVDGKPFNLLDKLNVKINQQRGEGYAIYDYPGEALDRIHREATDIIQGKELEGSVYETSLELLMQAQEIVVSEQKGRMSQRPASVCAALITTASACEVFVRDFIRRHGSPLHKFISKEKDRAFSVENLLNDVLADNPAFGKPLKDFNAELAHNIYLLFKARNSATHKGKPVLNLKGEKQVYNEATDEYDTKEIPVTCPVESWMVYAEIPRSMIHGDVDGEFGTYVWDVLALIEWLRVMVGGTWIKPAVAQYWNNQAALPVRSRELEITASNTRE